MLAPNVSSRVLLLTAPRVSIMRPSVAVAEDTGWPEN